MRPRSKSAAMSNGSLESRCRLIQQLGCFIGLGAIEERRIVRHGHGKRSDVILAHDIAELKVFRTIDVEVLRPHPDHEHLPDLFLE